MREKWSKNPTKTTAVKKQYRSTHDGNRVLTKQIWPQKTYSCVTSKVSTESEEALILALTLPGHFQIWSILRPMLLACLSMSIGSLRPLKLKFKPMTSFDRQTSATIYLNRSHPQMSLTTICARCHSKSRPLQRHTLFPHPPILYSTKSPHTISALTLNPRPTSTISHQTPSAPTYPSSFKNKKKKKHTLLATHEPRLRN